MQRSLLLRAHALFEGAGGDGEAKIVADELPYISLFYLNNVVVFNKRIQGMTLYPSGEYEFLSDITIKE